MAINKHEIGKTGSVRYSNTSSDEIQITEDKLRLKLEHYLTNARKSKDWVSWLGIFVTTLLTLVTADFHDLMGFDKSFFRNVCVLVCIGSFIAVIVTAIKSSRNNCTVESFINSCKNEE